MLRHVVMWKLKDFAEGSTKAENAKKAKELLEGLKNQISEILSINVGIDVSKDDDNFDIVLVSDFENQESLEGYLNHPKHVEVGVFISQVRKNRVCVDYYS